MKIILDAMGGDHAPEAPVLGAIDAAKAYGVEITLVGRGEAILEVMKKHNIETLSTRIWKTGAIQETRVLMPPPPLRPILGSPGQEEKKDHPV